MRVSSISKALLVSVALHVTANGVNLPLEEIEKRSLEAGLGSSTSNVEKIETRDTRSSVLGRDGRIKPKIFIIDMFPPEGEAWYGIPEFDLLAHNITVPGISPLYPDVHCTENYEICQLVTGEAEINAAATMTALTFSPLFCLEKTYFLIAGIGGINPKEATLGSVTFARYIVQFGLQYEFDAREIPENFTTGYVPQGSTFPSEYPQTIYGTEAFEVNKDLLEVAMGFAKTAQLNDSAGAAAYRKLYAKNPLFAAGAKPPSVVQCDLATSDVYFTGDLLCEAAENYTRLVTNGSGVYCNTAQEDAATLEALLRGALHKLVDFSRIIVMRTASDFDRPPPGVTATVNLWYAAGNQDGFEPSLMNIYLAGIKVVEGILGGWEHTFEEGIKATNYIGDILATLGGTPDYGPANFNNNPVKRSLHAGKRSRQSTKGQRLRA